MVVEKFNNSNGPRFSDMPVTVDGVDLDWDVLCSIPIWVCPVCLGIGLDL